MWRKRYMMTKFTKALNGISLSCFYCYQGAPSDAADVKITSQKQRCLDSSFQTKIRSDL